MDHFLSLLFHIYRCYVALSVPNLLKKNVYLLALLGIVFSFVFLCFVTPIWRSGSGMVLHCNDS